MSNPLLQPNDRFRRPSVVDAEGHNRFGELPSAEAEEATARRDNNLLASPSDSSPVAYQPEYVAALPHRGRFIAGLGTAGFFLCWLLLLTFTDYILLGVVASLLGVTVSLAALVLGYQDLKGMTLGAVDPEGRSATLLGFRLALAGVLLGGGAVVTVIGLLIRGILELVI